MYKQVQMETDIKIFITSLKHEGYSPSSLKNYKTDIVQFVDWKKQEKLDDVSFRSAFAVYKKFLKLNYKNSSFKRKVASISKFLEFQDPQPITPVKSKRSFSKSYQRNAILLGVYSLLLVSLLVTIPLIADDHNKVEPSAEIPNVNIRSTDYKDIKADGVKVSVSAPDNIETTPEDIIALAQSNVDILEDSNLNNSSGTSTIEEDTNTVTIYANSVSEDSFVYLTPISPTFGNILYIESQGEGWFRVSIENQAIENIDFKWTVINNSNSNLL